MKSLFIVLFLSNMLANTQAQTHRVRVILESDAGYSFKLKQPVIGLQPGILVYNRHHVYASLITHALGHSNDPDMFGGRYGYSMFNNYIQPFIGGDWQQGSTDINHNTVNRWAYAYGVKGYFKRLPLKATFQRSGDYYFLTLGFYGFP